MSNWKHLKQKLDKNKSIAVENERKESKVRIKTGKFDLDKTSKKRKREISDSLQQTTNDQLGDEKIKSEKGEIFLSNKYKYLWPKIVALDCEMVGIGISGKHSALARCSMVDFHGNEIYDKFVRPPALVTDFRTKWSGIRKKDLRADKAISLLQCQEEVAAILRDKILVGHALKNDLNALLLKHSKSMIRDTSLYRPFMRPHGRKEGKFKPRSLKELTKQFLGKIIQTGEHDSCEDARAALNLYKLKQEEWEEFLRMKKTQTKRATTDDSDDNGVEDDQELDEKEDPTEKSKIEKSRKSSVKIKSSIFGLEGLVTGPSMSIAEADARLAKRLKK